MDDTIAKQIFFGLRAQGLTEYSCAWSELPKDYRAQLQAIADSLPVQDPYQKLNEFTDRSKAIGHYVVAPLVTAFLQCEDSNDGI